MPPKRKLVSQTKKTSAPKKQKVSTDKAVVKKKKETGKSVPSAVGDALGPLPNYLKDGQWKKVLGTEFDQGYFKELGKTLAAEYKQGKEIFPPTELIFNAFNLTPVEKVKVVILGQDPYHDNNQAMGLSFSVDKGIAVPPSLKNIYKELVADPKVKGFVAPDHGCLVPWAEQGVLLLNATLTVEAHKPNSHAKFGWQKFTDNVIKAVSDTCSHVVFILWGGFAHKKEKLVNQEKHCIIKTAHPSPLSFGKFLNCHCFSDCNAALQRFGLKPIDWSL